MSVLLNCGLNTEFLLKLWTFYWLQNKFDDIWKHSHSLGISLRMKLLHVVFAFEILWAASTKLINWVKT